MNCFRRTHRRLLFPSLVVLATLAGPAWAADGFPPLTEAERALEQVSWHPTAPAVVLFEKATLKLRDYPSEPSSYLDVEVRLKILTKEGMEYGEVTIPHSRVFRLEKKSLKGRTVLGDGRVVPLDPESVFREKRSQQEKRFVTKATFPALEVGAILDYRYTMHWDDVMYLEPWEFNNDIPTLLSEITYFKPGNMAVLFWWRETSKRSPIHREDGRTSRGHKIRAWMENVPAIPDEPHSFPRADLTSRFMLIPTEIRVGGSRLDLMSSWKSVCENFEDWFYKDFRRGREAKKRAVALTGGASSPREKAAAIYAFVRDEIRTDAWYDVYVSDESDVDRVLKDRSGAQADKALLLQAMLEAVKVKTRLVWAGSRRDGQIDFTVANPWWFERVLVAVELGGERVVLDPSDRRLGFGQLSPGYEGTKALLHAKKQPEEITLPARSCEENARRAVLDLALDEEGRVTGTGSLQLDGHHAWRRLYWKDGEEATAEAWQEWLADSFEGYDLSDVRVEESVEPQQIRVRWSMAQREEEVLGDESSLTPSLPLGPVHQQFTLSTAQRMTPVQLAFGDRDEVEMTLTWPEGWELDLTPEARDWASDVGAIVVGVELDEPSRRLTVKRRFDITRIELGRPGYEMLRNLYSEVEKNDAQSLVLVRHD